MPLRIVPLIATLVEHQGLLDLDPVRYRPDRCLHPECGRAGGLSCHGHYLRKPHRGKVDTAAWELAPVKVPRFKCRHCGHTFSSLPSCLPPRRWYPWAVQAAVLVQLLAGGSLHACVREHGPARSTVRRWWRWLQDSHPRFSSLLRRRTPELGRATHWREFWQRCLEEGPMALGEVMGWLHGQGISVP